MLQTAVVSFKHHNGNIWANLSAESTAGTLVLLCGNSCQIALLVGGIAHDDKFSRTGESAESAPFAT
jgi:hypothetical protein